MSYLAVPSGSSHKWPVDAEFDEDESFVWSFLKPASFNKDVHLGWRLYAKELMKREATAQAARDACQGKRRKHYFSAMHGIDNYSCTQPVLHAYTL